MARRVLIVCGGNTCRSPMAEVMLRNMLRSRAGREWQVESAGVCTVDGLPASDNAQTAVAEIGLDLSQHRSRQLTAELVRGADMILAMEKTHLARVLELDPSCSERTRLIADCEVSDPFGGSIATYRGTRDEIRTALSEIVSIIDGSVQ